MLALEKNQARVMTGVQYGPLQEAGQISSGLDYYKPTMSQIALEREPVAEVTFTFKNRGEQRLADYIDPKQLQARLDWLGQKGWSAKELDSLASIKHSDGRQVFTDDFRGYLNERPLPPVDVRIDPETNDLAIDATGEWPMVTFWETIVMSEVNEAYFENYLIAHGLDPLEVYDEGDVRLSAKVEILKQHPDIKILEFGTRRHFSLRWQRHVLKRLMKEVPENLVGTSNVGLARSLGLSARGTFAHEMDMVYAGLADARGRDIRGSHHKFLTDWYERYGEDYSIALTDTFGSDFFLADFSDWQAKSWRGLRHDSGDPVEFGERVIEFYKEHSIDPATKTIVFSDGLDIDKIVHLHEHFKGRVNLLFGWGTTLTNDLGIPTLNIVMKATAVNGVETVKLSDNSGKHTGSTEQVERYKNVFSV